MTKIGLLDSGVGGLSVLRALWQELNGVEFAYYADTINMPYGSKTPEEIRRLVLQICSFLYQQDSEIIIMACNTASALALCAARQSFPIPILGIIGPAALVAAKTTRNGRIGVVATVGTTKSGAYDNALLRVDSRLKVYSEACPWLASLIESGLSENRDVVQQLKHCLQPLIMRDIDTLVLGCTHYALLTDILPELLPKSIAVVDPAKALAAQVKSYRSSGEGQNKVKFFSSGPVEKFSKACASIIGYRPQVESPTSLIGFNA